jgi:hypothetical protein
MSKFVVINTKLFPKILKIYSHFSSVTSYTISSFSKNLTDAGYNKKSSEFLSWVISIIFSLFIITVSSALFNSSFNDMSFKLIVNLKINQSLLKEYFICHIKRNTP